jgi:histidine triad (HIT) family protein
MGQIDAGELDAAGVMLESFAAMEETLFSKIIARKIPAKIAYEDERYIAIHDINPQAPVHLLVIAKKVIPTLNDLTTEDAELVGGMFLVAAKLMKQLGHRDYRTVFNCGPGAQQTVFHLHLHVLAGRPFEWPPG